MLASQPSLYHSSTKPSPLRRSRRRSSPIRNHRSVDDAKPQTRSAKTITQRPRRASSPTPKTTSQPRDRLSYTIYEMPLDSTSVAAISALAATARDLFRRAKTSGPDFAAVATVVRSLHTVLKHMRSEAEDPDSLLNGTQQESSLYARQLTPIVEDTDFTLKQLDTILEKYGSCPGDNSSEDGEHAWRNGGASGRKIEDRERDMLQLIRTKLANQKTHIDIFLDTVQLHNPSRQHQPVDLQHVDDKQQNSIKDKIDLVAQRLFQRRARARVLGEAAEGSDEEMWQQFWAELVKEGFSSDVLRKHKEVLRAYIRELEANGSVDDEPPSVRGLLDHANSGSAYASQPYPSYPNAPASAYGSRQQYGSSPLPPPVAVRHSYQSRGDDWSPKEMLSPSMDNEKYAPAVKLERRRPEQSPMSCDNINGDLAGAHSGQNYQQASPISLPVLRSYERHSSDSSDTTDSSGTQQLALISTQDLMDMDGKAADALAARVGMLNLSPALPPVSSSYSASPATPLSGRYPPPPSTFQGPPTSDPRFSSSPTKHALGSSPRYVPSMAAYSASPASSSMTPPPAYSTTTLGGTDPINIPSTAPPTSAGLAPPSTAASRRSRLAPDSKGAEIPLEAKWTRIKRSLVSPEVLEKAGFRYEARPEFVAILGELSRDDIAQLARKSAEVRATRGRGYSDASRTTRPATAYYPEDRRGGNTRKSSRHSDDTDDDSDTSYDLWDNESDSDSSISAGSPGSRQRERRTTSSTDKYIPRDVRRQQRRRRRDSATIIQEEPEGEEADEDTRRGGRGAKAYPVIVQPPMEKGSPSATVLPKPILKNKNENHVRFDEDGPREMSVGDLDRERERRERRERRRRDRDAEDRRRRDKDRSDRDRDRERERDRDRDRDRERERDRDRDRERERERERERHRDRDGRDHHSSSHHGRHRGERERDREEARERRRAKKSVWGETLGAVGIGGAAASLLSVLTEAAAGF